MPKDLAGKILKAMATGRYDVGVHATNMLRDRGVHRWQVEAGSLESGRIRVRPSSRPNPSIVVHLVLPDGEPAIAVWSWLQERGMARLVSVFFPD